MAAVRRGDAAAFDRIYTRHAAALHSYCRHMLSCQHEAEDAVQQTFLNAFRALKADDREVRLRPWLYRIAHNHCISVIRRRRELPDAEVDSPVAGIEAHVERREEVRTVLRDVAALPEAQRRALVLSELETLSHAEIAAVLGCREKRVKALVFQARQSLAKDREAREVSCEEIREQLTVMRGGGLRRALIRRHLRACEGCRDYRATVRRERAAASWMPGTLPGQSLAGAGLGGTAIATATAGKSLGLLGGLKALVAALAIATGAGAAAPAHRPAPPATQPSAPRPVAHRSIFAPAPHRAAARAAGSRTRPAASLAPIAAAAAPPSEPASAAGDAPAATDPAGGGEPPGGPDTTFVGRVSGILSDIPAPATAPAAGSGSDPATDGSGATGGESAGSGSSEPAAQASGGS